MTFTLELIFIHISGAWCDRETGEIRTMKLAHDIAKVGEFYSMVQGPTVHGVEASRPWPHGSNAEAALTGFNKRSPESQRNLESGPKMRAPGLLRC